MPDLDSDDRFEEIKRLLDSTLSEFKSLFQSAGGFDDSRVGNGWDPGSLSVDIYCLTPKPLDELGKIAAGRKRSLFRNRVFTFLKPKEAEVEPAGDAKVSLIPFWKIKGYHECFYFRGNSYKVDVPNDVVAVEVEGRIRDLVNQEGGDLLRITNLPRRLLGMRNAGGVKCIQLNDVTELAYMYEERSIFLNSDGKEDLEGEAFFESRVSLRKIRDAQLSEAFPNSEIAPTLVSKEELVRRLHALIVKPPVAFSKILSNRFQITELSEYLVPVYSFMFKRRGQKKSIRLHGYTGGVYQ